MKTVIALATALLSSAMMVAPAQAQTTQAPAKQALTRAEVRADLALWNRAGLNQTSLYDSYSVEDVSMQERLAQYHDWRYGPEFVAEVTRQNERTMTAGAASSRSMN